ncbi:MAG TPA: zf-TFIIB domain-containing protein [Actinomycetales bacterium]|nr:zf-TFIIB domain-containing protein [Actinomycetales bacterium]
MDLTCPKCHGTMRQYERNNVMVDQCTECRGVFLDRGELEKLIDAEARWADQSQQYQPGNQQQQQYQPHHEQGHPGGYQDQQYRQHYYKKHKRRSFLDELFD